MADRRADGPGADAIAALTAGVQSSDGGSMAGHGDSIALLFVVLALVLVELGGRAWLHPDEAGPEPLATFWWGDNR